MTNYREILRLSALGLSQQSIAQSCNASKRTVNTVLKAARRENISWPLDNDQTNAALAAVLFPSSDTQETVTNKRMPDFEYIRKELLRNGVNKKLLWTEYLEECRLSGEEPLRYPISRTPVSPHRNIQFLSIQLNTHSSGTNPGVGACMTMRHDFSYAEWGIWVRANMSRLKGKWHLQ